MAETSAGNLLFTSDDGLTVNLVIPGNSVYNAFTRLHFSGRAERKEGNGIVGCCVWTTCL